MKILYVGSLDKKHNSYKRFETLRELGNEVIGIDIDRYIFQAFFTPFHFHLNIGPGIYQLNKKIMKCVEEFEPHLLFVDNKPYISATTLKKIKSSYPELKMVNLITDDFCGLGKRSWRLFRKTAGFYDIQFVQRPENINELKSYGAKRVELCYRSFDPKFHRPIIFSEADKTKYYCTVGFIGTYEKEREEFIAWLIKNNVPVKVVGDGWPKGEHWKIIEPFYKGPSVYGDEYIKIINGMEIALHFLRKGNRDQQDSRTFEIPACGVFMIAEDSDVHRELFIEDKEVVLFKTKEELLKKVLYYSDKPEERKEISLKGYQRCYRSGYDHASRLRVILNNLIDGNEQC